MYSGGKPRQRDVNYTKLAGSSMCIMILGKVVAPFPERDPPETIKNTLHRYVGGGGAIIMERGVCRHGKQA